MIKSMGIGLLLCMFSLPGLASSWDGVVDWAQRTEMGTSVSGVVASVAVKEGDRVKKGQLLLQLEQEALQARLAQRQSEMKHNELLMKEARKELERAEELYARTLLADHDLNVAKIAHAEADAAYKASRAEYQQAREDLNNSSLRSPYNAVVLSRNIQPAQAVISRCEVQSLLTLASAEKLLVRIFVDADELGKLQNNGKVDVEVAGQRYRGQVDAIDYKSERVKERARYPVNVLFTAKDLMLVGQTAKVSQ